MLSSIVIEMEVEGAPRDLPGFLVHGWFLNHAIGTRDPALASALHGNVRHKPFTVSPLLFRSGPNRNRGALRLTGLSEPVSSLLLSLTADALGETCIGDQRLRCVRVHRDPESHPLAWHGDIHTLAARIDAVEPTMGIRLTFASPTAFASSIRNVVALFPDPERLFSRLAATWNAHAPDDLAVRESTVAGLVRNLFAERYELKTAPVPLKHQPSRGFVGWCEYQCEAATHEDVRRLAHRLALFAAVSGVGMRTTQGMGQTFGAPVMPREREPVSPRDAQVALV